MMNAKFSFWYIEVFAYYAYNLVYLFRSILEQKIELVLNIYKELIRSTNTATRSILSPVG